MASNILWEVHCASGQRGSNSSSSHAPLNSIFLRRRDIGSGERRRRRCGRSRSTSPGRGIGSRSSTSTSCTRSCPCGMCDMTWFCRTGNSCTLLPKEETISISFTIKETHFHQRRKPILLWSFAKKSPIFSNGKTKCTMKLRGYALGICVPRPAQYNCGGLLFLAWEIGCVCTHTVVVLEKPCG